MKRLRLALIFAAVLQIAIQIIGAADVMGADDALQPLITTAELTVGQNRFAFGLAKRGKLIERADVLVRVFDLQGAEAHFTAETNAPFRPVANPVPGKKVHRHADGSQHVHDDGNAKCGAFTWPISLLHGPVTGALSSWRGNRTGCPRRRDLRSWLVKHQPRRR